MCAEVALACRPRYHVAAGKRAFFARAPYLNSDLGAGGHATRFIGLAEVRAMADWPGWSAWVWQNVGGWSRSARLPWSCLGSWLPNRPGALLMWRWACAGLRWAAQVGNTSKQKWLHALALTPAAEMTPEQVCWAAAWWRTGERMLLRMMACCWPSLAAICGPQSGCCLLTPSLRLPPLQLTAVPEGTTKCPYEVASRKRGADAMDDEQLGAQDWRWQQRGGKRQQGGQQQRLPVAAPSLGGRGGGVGLTRNPIAVWCCWLVFVRMRMQLPEPLPSDFGPPTALAP